MNDLDAKLILQCISFDTLMQNRIQLVFCKLNLFNVRLQQ